MDRMIGQILDALERNGLSENTVVLYMSDHGDMAGERELWMKRCYYEDSVKVPALLSWPGVISEGATCDRLRLRLEISVGSSRLTGSVRIPVDADCIEAANHVVGKLPIFAFHSLAPDPISESWV